MMPYLKKLWRHLKATEKISMRLLIDTHVFLWWILDDASLSPRARRLIEDAGNEIFFSAASAWEIVIKTKSGKLALPGRPDLFVSEQLSINGFTPIAISVSHALSLDALPNLHRDPFDRILVAQSMVEKMSIVTADSLIKQYPIETHW